MYMYMYVCMFCPIISVSLENLDSFVFAVLSWHCPEAWEVIHWAIRAYGQI